MAKTSTENFKNTQKSFPSNPDLDVVGNEIIESVNTFVKKNRRRTIVAQDKVKALVSPVDLKK